MIPLKNSARLQINRVHMISPDAMNVERLRGKQKAFPKCLKPYIAYRENITQDHCHTNIMPTCNRKASFPKHMVVANLLGAKTVSSLYMFLISTEEFRLYKER